jgi:hypothetical protein
MATLCTVCVRVSDVWTVGVPTVCRVCVGSVCFVDWMVWLRSVQFVWVSGVWTVWYGYGLYSLCARECLVCGLFGVNMVCTVCVGSVWWVECLVWLRSVQFLWGVSGVWNVWCGYGLYSLCESVWCVECLMWLGSVQFVCECLVCRLWCGYVLYSLCWDCLVCGLWDVATVCAIWVESVRCWTVWYGYVL